MRDDKTENIRPTGQKRKNAMPAAFGDTDKVHPLAHHDHQAHHHHAAGRCAHDHDHVVLRGHCHHHREPDEDVIEAEDDLMPDRGTDA